MRSLCVSCEHDKFTVTLISRDDDDDDDVDDAKTHVVLVSLSSAPSAALFLFELLGAVLVNLLEIIIQVYFQIVFALRHGESIVRSVFLPPISYWFSSFSQFYRAVRTSKRMNAFARLRRRRN